ncbi:Sialic acid TRAP transporter large permease protein SiaM [subsurface metagenome]
MFLGFPIAFAIGITAMFYLFLTNNLANLIVIPQVMFTSLDVFPFLAIPGFILAGELMTETKITNILVEFSKKIVGFIPGGLAHVNILASIFFAGISGSSLADAAGLGALEIPMMVEGGYTKKFSAAVTAASSVIGPIIPPSISMVIYALIAGNVSIGAMFLAGYFPGIVLGIILIIYCYIYAKIKNIAISEKADIKRIIHYFKIALIPLGMPMIIMGGILGGIFTATEASVVAIFYALIVGFFILKTLKLSDLPRILRKAGITSSVASIMVAMAKGLAYFLTEQEVIQKISITIMNYCSTKEIFLLIIIFIFILTGCFFDVASGMIILVPILLPIAMEFGIHPLHFGIMTTLGLSISVITPPVGPALFICAKLADVSFDILSREILPFIFMEAIVLFIVVYWQDFVLFLPRLFGFA